jgi:hypothetical protein
MQHHKYSLSDINEMIPWEREVYLNYLKQWLEKQQQEHQSRK